MRSRSTTRTIRRRARSGSATMRSVQPATGRRSGSAASSASACASERGTGSRGATAALTAPPPPASAARRTPRAGSPRSRCSGRGCRPAPAHASARDGRGCARRRAQRSPRSRACRRRTARRPRRRSARGSSRARRPPPGPRRSRSAARRTAASGTRQESTGSPSISTVQAPHSPSPQPSLVPVRPSGPRSRSSSRAIGSPSRVAALAVDRALRPSSRPPAAAASRRSGVAGISSGEIPVAFSIACAAAGAAAVHRQLADALGAERPALPGPLEQVHLDRRRVLDGRNDVGGQPIVEVAAVLHLDLLDQRPAQRLERAAFDLPLAQRRVDRPPHLADRGDAQRPHPSVSGSTSTSTTSAPQA